MYTLTLTAPASGVLRPRVAKAKKRRRVVKPNRERNPSMPIPGNSFQQGVFRSRVSTNTPGSEAALICGPGANAGGGKSLSTSLPNGGQVRVGFEGGLQVPALPDRGGTSKTSMGNTRLHHRRDEAGTKRLEASGSRRRIQQHHLVISPSPMVVQMVVDDWDRQGWCRRNGSSRRITP